ncbi:MAG TPA: hypothetical protein VMG12_10555 [Polyangiaceae bacterium]|nr:hypothetical protein [Polyangiaceae bacterium]
MREELVGIGMKGTIASVVALGMLCGAARDARADSNGVKGTVGGAMLGAEVVMLTESAFRLRPTWMYLAGGAAGGLAGGYFGYKLSDDGSNRPPSFLLAGGIALIIPTIMGVLTATQYEPIGTIRQEPSDSDANDGDSNGGGSRDDDNGDAPADVESNDPDARGGEPERGEGARALAPRLELPSVGLAQAFSRDEIARYGVRQTAELHLTLLRGVF